LSVAGERITDVAGGCELGVQWFRRHADAEPVPAAICGKPADFLVAVSQAAGMLRAANRPLVYGLSRSAVAGQRAAVALAEAAGAVIDTTASMCHGPSIMALQEAGEVTCTLGEVRNRADLVIYWGCNPALTHPRHAERYAVFPSGRHTPAGRANRVVVMVGDAGEVESWRLDPFGSTPDLVVPLEPERSFEALQLLRQLVFDDAGRHAPAALHELAGLIRRCRCGIVFFGLGLVGTNLWDGRFRSDAAHVNVQALLAFVAELNRGRRFYARRMRLQGGVSGADNVLSWQTGFPFAVDLSRGYPRYGPTEFTANALLEGQDVDACVLIGTETIEALSPSARSHLASLPTIVIDYPGSRPPFTPAVSFATAVYGLHAPGTIYRMDNVPLPLQPVLPTSLPTDEAVLNAIQREYEGNP
jgi:formylmethanofuran dehydrogenase subunit B